MLWRCLTPSQSKGVLMGHANARLTVHGRLLAVQRVAAGYRVADVAAQLGCSRTTIYKWINRHRSEGADGLSDRSSRPRRSPGRTPVEVEDRIIGCRIGSRRGAGWIAAELGLPVSTVGRVIRRAGLPVFSRLDALTGELVRTGPVTTRRYERARPGDLLHIDVKKLGRIPLVGGGGRLAEENAPPTHAATGGTTCTRRSMTTPASPTPRSTLMSKAAPAPGSSPAPPGSLRPSASPVSGR